MKNIIVSNRLPIKMTMDKDKNINFSYTSGGLSSAIRSLDMDFTWVGWSGSFVSDKNEQNIVKSYFGKKNIIPLFFDKENFDNYYNGFSNNVIWCFGDNNKAAESPDIPEPIIAIFILWNSLLFVLL